MKLRINRINLRIVHVPAADPPRSSDLSTNSQFRKIEIGLSRTYLDDHVLHLEQNLNAALAAAEHQAGKIQIRVRDVSGLHDRHRILATVRVFGPDQPARAGPGTQRLRVAGVAGLAVAFSKQRSRAASSVMARQRSKLLF